MGGLKQKDIEFYHIYRFNALDLIDLIDRNFLHIVLIRYSKIMNDSFFFKNKKAKTILNEVILKTFENRIRFMLEKYKVYEESANVRGIENYPDPINQIPQYYEKYETGLYGILPFYKDIANFFNYKIAPQIIKEDITNMILSYLRLIEFPKDKIIKDDTDTFFKDKDKILEDFIIRNKKRDMDYAKNDYSYENLIKIRFDTQELFQRIKLNYIK